ncbi:MAG: gliding motility-associated C-terminal domain-containing protein [Bacteroidetes bacterium]|nr:gliding motility-associated C-terminal domain-containing protein [Bacteroidota bacterium]
MPKMYTSLKYLLILAAVFTSFQVSATHNRAGEISIRQVGDCNSLTVIATVTTYTKTSAVPADRDTLTLCWGDGFCERVARANGPGNPPQGTELENDIKYNTYVATHTFPARGTYKISMTDPNRNGGVVNVNHPNSDNVKFHIETTYTFLNPQFQGCNNTPVLLQPPIDKGCVGQPFVHNPNAYDIDGDSLSYQLIVPLQDIGTPVPNYRWPTQLSPGPDNALSIDEVTGDIVWNSPQEKGEYNIAMIIVEHRNGIAIDTVIRDMQILIENCDNLPPEIETDIEEICVIAGELIEFEVTATAPASEPHQKVSLTALGGPFEVTISPAEFIPFENDFHSHPYSKDFTWQTTCEHISDQFYSVIFKAVDNYFADTSGLAELKTIRIKVVGPPPENLQAVPGSGQVELSWGKPYSCEGAADNYFQGFTVWRREGSNQFPIDICTPGLDGRGYTQITSNILEVVDGRYYFLDDQVERGRTYCYRVMAEFAKTSPVGGYTYNRVQSLPSDEICVQLNRDVPIITNVSVEITDINNGLVEVRWSKPNTNDLDTLLNPGPYRYQVLRANSIGGQDFSELPDGSFTTQGFAEANDTVFTDSNINTLESAYAYKIDFYIEGNQLLGSTNSASSLFLNVMGTDNTNILSWEEDVPWDNYQYVVYRLDDQGVFISLDTIVEQPYSDTGLLNGEEYCYKIESIGSYGVDGIVNPILNFSQEACGVPIDDVPPCPPELEVTNICDEADPLTPEEAFENHLSWINPMELCPETDDVVGYNVYYAPTENAEFSLLDGINSSDETTYIHTPEQGIAGCYAVTALDTFFNESIFSNIICVENCWIYELPNVFTPNNDGQNDLFVPFRNRFIQRIELNVFNRWGELVFTTTDPKIRWDGKNRKGKDLAEGTYHYTCRVFEQQISGLVQSVDMLGGYIELIRGR